MPAPLKLRDDYSAAALRNLVKGCKSNSQSRRLLSLAAVMDGMDRNAAARICGMDSQTLHDWVLRFNEFGPGGLIDRHGGGTKPRPLPAQNAEIAALVEAGPDLARDDVVRWRRHSIVLLLPVEVGRLAYPSLPADILDRNAVRSLLQNKCLLCVRELRFLHRPPLLPAKGTRRGKL